MTMIPAVTLKPGDLFNGHRVRVVLRVDAYWCRIYFVDAGHYVTVGAATLVEVVRERPPV